MARRFCDVRGVSCSLGTDRDARLRDRRRLPDAVTGNDEMRREGRAQQDKGDAQREVAAKEAEAEKARADAKALEGEQRSHQD